jgi:RNA polymerase sigma-70 factor (ECF subfamily)
VRGQNRRGGGDVTEADVERRRWFEALFGEHVAGIASYCRWQSRSPGDVDDAVAEVFLVAWRRLGDMPRGKAVRPWLYGTARRVIANQARSQARRSRLQERLGVSRSPPQVSLRAFLAATAERTTQG